MTLIILAFKRLIRMNAFYHLHYNGKEDFHNYIHRAQQINTAPAQDASFTGAQLTS